MNTMISMSNLSSSMITSRQNSQLKHQTFEIGNSLATGEKGNTEIALSGEGRRLASIDQELSLLDVYSQSNSSVSVKLEAIQLSLANIRSTSKSTSLSVINELGAMDSTQANSLKLDIMPELQSVVSSLNQSVNGETLFSGASTDKGAITSAEDIVADLKLILSTASDATNAQAAIDFYFDDPSGGFQTNIYSGSISNSGDVRVSDSEFIDFLVRADNSAIKMAIRSLATMEAISTGTSGPIANTDLFKLLENASQEGLSADKGLITLQQTIGGQQEKLENTEVRNDAISFSLSKSRLDITSVDLFETASKFEELQTQMQAAYQVTMRLNSLSLANYLG